ncbi:UNVERIFIED_CONTAM: hypothetical protein Slati_0901200 [Sesamum latifolium]|uniref:Uncharacterized protein n=1 Tax=Sesamum latifolium TaxID=2727402 RepID=A0AAW2XNJ3_9LAMI
MRGVLGSGHYSRDGGRPGSRTCPTEVFGLGRLLRNIGCPRSRPLIGNQQMSSVWDIHRESAGVLGLGQLLIVRRCQQMSLVWTFIKDQQVSSVGDTLVWDFSKSLMT